MTLQQHEHTEVCAPSVSVCGTKQQQQQQQQ